MAGRRKPGFPAFILSILSIDVRAISEAVGSRERKARAPAGFGADNIVTAHGRVLYICRAAAPGKLKCRDERNGVRWAFGSMLHAPRTTPADTAGAGMRQAADLSRALLLAQLHGTAEVSGEMRQEPGK